jgi:hypothetical protein
MRASKREFDEKTNTHALHGGGVFDVVNVGT